MRLRWTLEAANDLESISDYLLEQHPQLAQPTVRRIYAEIKELSRFPVRGRIGRELGTRELILTGLPYVVVFRANDARVEILRIFHGAQDWT
jgi:toxin ParE1/3/4